MFGVINVLSGCSPALPGGFSAATEGLSTYISPGLREGCDLSDAFSARLHGAFLFCHCVLFWFCIAFKFIRPLSQ